MVSTSKILTVSYGTFSCTLEGFDDPFSTMRSIAEYFRDLAADDRYFGAEPPTPDAEMLHRIAEREIQHKVDARIEDNNVVLRQMDSPLPEGKASVVPGEALLHQPESTETAISALTHKTHAAPASSTEVVETAQTQDKPANKVDAPAELSDSSIAAKLQRIRAVVGNRQPAAGVDTDNNLENGLGDDFFAGSESPKIETDLDEVEAETAEDSAPPEQIVAEDILETEDALETFAQDAEPLEPKAEALLDDTPEADDILHVSDDSDDFDEGVLEAKSLSEPKDAPLTLGVSDAASKLDADADILSGISAALSEDPSPFEMVDDEAEESEDENDFAKNSAPKPVAIARVIKVRRAEQADKNQPATDPIETQVSDFSSEESTLPDNEEASLLAELAAVEKQAEQETQIVKAGLQNFEIKPVLTAFDDGEFSGTDALDRIMAKTNTKINSDEATRKRTSIAHLRAAVLAKRAEGQPEDADDDTSEEYREDLARVVKPRRPTSGRKQLGRRLAPLVLVSEQRVDEISNTPAEKETPARDAPTSVRPRRVSKDQPSRKGNSGSATDADAPHVESRKEFANRFNDFATQTQAKGISEWFEAAAAFRIYIVGQETFSRPQLMGLVLKTSPENGLTRETALAAFGQLIREGTIKKIERGRYTISENTRFRPDQERASA